MLLTVCGLSLAGGCKTSTPVTATQAVLDSADQVLLGMTHYVTDAGVLRARVRADTAYFFSSTQRAELRNVHVTFYDVTGRSTSTLTAREGTHHWRTGDMEARGKGRTLNTCLSQTVRGAIVTHTRHQAATHGIAVVIVPPRGTSKYCPYCLTAFRHHKAPNHRAAGWAWASCPNTACGYSTGRDNAAWQRTGARGLTHQHTTRLDRTSGIFVIRTVAEALDQASQVQHQTWDRTKSGPTNKRPAPGKRRRVPAPPDHRAPTARPGGKRPAGRPPTHPTHRSQRRTRQQGPTTIGTPARHHPDGARLGAGFHRHAHTTPIPRWPWPSHPPERSRTPGITQETQAD